MEVISGIKELKEKLSAHRKKNKSVGFVPTMGALHEGHLSLVRKAKSDNDITVVSIFVNPKQFAPNEDLAAYPRDIENDKKMLVEEGVDYVFYPSVDEMYKKDSLTSVDVSGLTEYLCGRTRKSHFKGVATVVVKLFNIVRPDRAYFGKKDYQQYLVIKKIVEDLDIDIEIVGMPIIRDANGIALSSRNQYLVGTQKQSALALSRSFELVEKAVLNGAKMPPQVMTMAKEFILAHRGTAIDYIEFVHPETLQPMNEIKKPFLYAVAIKVGETRLIDNKLFE